MKRLFILALAGLLFLGVFSAPAVAGRDIVKVMTQNQYLGSDLSPLIQPPPGVDPSDAARAVLDQIEANNFPLRARRFATQVALTKPHLIGLQEVIKIDITLDGQNDVSTYVDHLVVTLAALDAKGQRYVDAAIVNNLDITILLDINGNQVPDLVRVLDRDVILARKGIYVEKLVGHHDNGGLCGVQIENPAFSLLGPKFLQSTPSEDEDGIGDGCNYTIAAPVIVPGPDGGPITISIWRGFVGVDATVRGKTYRFVNTHLEGMQPDSTDPGSAIIQSLQSVELIETLKYTTPPGRKLILLGDFNSSPEDVPIDISPPLYKIIPPYQIIVGAGFADVWDKNPFKCFDPNGYTCCQEKNLLNTTSLLEERIDIIFVRGRSFRPLAFVTGRMPIFPLSQPPNWASDHGGVFGQLIFRRGAKDWSSSRKTERP